jgi:hypothetical protein
MEFLFFFPKEKSVNFIEKYKIYILKNACENMHLIPNFSLLPKLETVIRDTQSTIKCLFVDLSIQKSLFLKTGNPKSLPHINCCDYIKF